MSDESDLIKKTNRGRKLSPKTVAEELRRRHGNMAAVARALGCSRDSVHKYVMRRPFLQNIRNEALETRIDIAEDSLDMAIQEGQGWAVCFFLKTRAKHRGYIESAPYQDPSNTPKPLVVKKGENIQEKPND